MEIWQALSRVPPSGAQASASGNRLPAGIALGYVWVIARGIVAVVPDLRGAGLAVVVAIVRIIIPSISVRISQPEKYAAAEPSKFAAVEPAAMEPPQSGVESPAMEPATS